MPPTSGTTNTALQPNNVHIRPLITGPNAGPSVMQAPPRLRYRPSFSRGAQDSTTFIMSGNKMPDPAACKIRLGSKTLNDGANRHRTSPATMHPHAKNSSLRVENRPDRKAMMAVKIDVTIM